MSTGDAPLFPRDDASALDLLRTYAESLDKITQKVDVIVLPEKIALASDAATVQVDDLFKATARRIGANIVVGIDRGTRTKRFNEARMYSPDGSLVATYDKHHMIPVFEATDQPGTTITVLDQPSGIWGIEICKDMDFPDLSRQYGSRDVGLLLVPAWDFVTDGWLHGRMAVMRGVESGFTIVRAARQGILSVSDDRGRILAEKSATEYFSLFASAPIRHNSTLYVRWGDWFAQLNIAGLFLLLFIPRKKPD
jgi:apolipoprotein N-acyltransferase